MRSSALRAKERSLSDASANMAFAMSTNVSLVAFAMCVAAQRVFPVPEK